MLPFTETIFKIKKKDANEIKGNRFETTNEPSSRRHFKKDFEEKRWVVSVIGRNSRNQTKKTNERPSENATGKMRCNAKVSPMIGLGSLAYSFSFLVSFLFFSSAIQSGAATDQGSPFFFLAQYFLGYVSIKTG